MSFDRSRFDLAAFDRGDENELTGEHEQGALFLEACGRCAVDLAVAFFAEVRADAVGTIECHPITGVFSALEAVATGTFSCTPTTGKFATFEAVATGTLAIVGEIKFYPRAELGAESGFALEAERRAGGRMTWPGTTTIYCKPIPVIFGSARLDGAGTVVARPTYTQFGKATLRGTGQTIAAATAGRRAALDLAGTGAVETDLTVAFFAEVLADGAGAIALEARRAGTAQVLADGAGGLALTGTIRARCSSVQSGRGEWIFTTRRAGTARIWASGYGAQFTEGLAGRLGVALYVGLAGLDVQGCCGARAAGRLDGVGAQTLALVLRRAGAARLNGESGFTTIGARAIYASVSAQAGSDWALLARLGLGGKLRRDGRGQLLLAARARWNSTTQLGGIGTIAVLSTPPRPNFMAMPTTGKPPLTVTFLNYTEGGGTITYFWSFGDGVTSTEKDPVHIYVDEGLYTVTLTATNEDGSASQTKANGIAAWLRPPVAEFSVDQAVGLTRSWTCHFTDESLFTPVRWLWEFGDGATSTDQHAVHMYLYGGVYTVTLRCWNVAGEAVETKYSLVNVIDVPPRANFTVTPDEGNPLGFLVQFESTSTGYPFEHYWLFGHVTCYTHFISTGRNGYEEIDVHGNLQKYPGSPTPTHFYDGPAREFTVSLKVRNTAGTHTVTKRGVVKLVDVNPTIAFVSYRPRRFPGGVRWDDPCAIDPTTEEDCPQTFVFVWTQTGFPLRIVWDFGDGTTQTEILNPCDYFPPTGCGKSKWVVHTFTYPGIYQVEARAYNSAGQMGYFAMLITVRWLPPIAKFSVDTEQAMQDHTFLFRDESLNFATSWHWDFGDGATSTQQHPSHRYQQNGVYGVIFTVTNPMGTSSVRKYIEVGLNDMLEIIYDIDSPPRAGRYIYEEFSSTWRDA